MNPHRIYLVHSYIHSIGHKMLTKQVFKLGRWVATSRVKHFPNIRTCIRVYTQSNCVPLRVLVWEFDLRVCKYITSKARKSMENSQKLNNLCKCIFVGVQVLVHSICMKIDYRHRINREIYILFFLSAMNDFLFSPGK